MQIAARIRVLGPDDVTILHRLAPSETWRLRTWTFDDPIVVSVGLVHSQNPLLARRAGVSVSPLIRIQVAIGQVVGEHDCRSVRRSGQPGNGWDNGWNLRLDERGFGRRTQLKRIPWRWNRTDPGAAVTLPPRPPV